MTTVADQLLAARDLIADPERWCEGDFARDDLGRQYNPRKGVESDASYCAMGALMAVGAMVTIGCPALSHLNRAVASLYGRTMNLSRVNDTLGHEAVMAVYDEAIRLAKDEGA